MKVIWSRHARDRLADIFQFIQHDSVTRASDFCVLLIEPAEQLGEYPMSGPVLPEDPAYRQLVVHEYRIAYKVTEDIVYVHTIVAPGMTYEHAL